MITVVNRHTHQATGNDVYIGRGTVYGNAFGLDTYGRKKAIELFRQDKIIEMTNNPNGEFAQALQRIVDFSHQGDVNLVCSCKPKACHGDIIIELIEDYL